MTVLIAGGGLAGAAAACLLGPRATLVEREAGPHDKVCGEFLSWEAQAALARLGLDLVALGATPIEAVRLIHRQTVVVCDLPFRGMGLSRRVLDEALLSMAQSRGATVLRGHAVRRLVRGGMEVSGIGRIEGAQVMLATGKHELRGMARAAEPGGLVGLKMTYRLHPTQEVALAGHVEVVLFTGGYAGLQLVEGGVANLCLLIERRRLARGGGWPWVAAHLAASSRHLAERLQGATQQLARPLAIAGMPYGFVHKPGPSDPDGVLRLGDQVGVIPSFSGDGMSIALNSAFAAVAATDAAVYHRRMGSDLRGQVGRAMLLHRLGQSHPSLLAATARAWPGALAWVARLTRVPARRLAWS